MAESLEDQASVYKAEPYRLGAMSSLGNASHMLLRQFKFPDICSVSLDVLLVEDSDRCLEHRPEKTQMCLKKHVGGSDSIMEYWLRNSSDEQIMDFLLDILEADRKITWTGYRVMGSVGGSGHNIWTFQLFAKHPKSNTEVYTGDRAPNVLPGKRW